MRRLVSGLLGVLAVGLLIAALRAPPDRASEAGAGRGDARDEVAALQERARELESQLQAMEPDRAPEAAGGWPAGLPEALSPGPLEASLRASVAPLGGTIVGADCAEYPCVFAVRWPEGMGDAALLAAVEASRVGLSGVGLEASARTSREGDARPGRSITMLSAWRAGDDVAPRRDARGRRLLRALTGGEHIF